MFITKRDGRSVRFDEQKIINAICAAFRQVDGDISEYALAKAKNIATYVEAEVAAGTLNSVEAIQDTIERGLMSTKRKDVAKAFILYRDERTRERNRNNSTFKAVKDKLIGCNIENSNANMDEASFGGRKGEAANAILKQIALDDYMSPLARKNHLENIIYTHDLDSFALGEHNCLSVPFDDLLANGFNTRQVDIRPAGSINTAFQLLAVIFQIQSLQQFGGVSATHLDWTMVPYVRKSFRKHMIDGLKFIEKIDDEEYLNSIPKELKFDDKEATDKRHSEAYNYAIEMTKRELDQAVEGMYHNLNSLQSRSGNQLPFSSINFGTCTLEEGRMVTKALLEGSLKGVGKVRRTSVFPCTIFQCMTGVNRKPGDPNYDLFKLALKSTAKRLYPNYANVDWSGNAGYDINDPRTYFSTMGKRKLQLM